MIFQLAAQVRSTWNAFAGRHSVGRSGQVPPQKLKVASSVILRTALFVEKMLPASVVDL
jgi:hypothetical protein